MRKRPRYILVSDFKTFELYDLDERQRVSFPLSDLPEHVQALGFILGQERRVFRDQDPANIEAAELVGRLHDALLETGYQGHDLECFLVRIVFCLFADDTGVFEPRDIFLEYIETRTKEDGTHLGAQLTELFQVLNTPQEKRLATRDEVLARFPYINGGLFDGLLRIPAFDAEMREKLLDVCRFDWSSISPSIFGALFQSVMDPEERRAQGAHYTTEKNILKVIEPLFMDDLWAEFERIKGRRDRGRLFALQQFQGETRFDVAALHAAMDGQRRSRRLTWKDVATESGVSAVTLTRLSQGCQPDVNSLAALTAWLGMAADHFMRSESVARLGAPSSLDQISSIIHRDPRLNPDGVTALKEMIKAAYARLRIDRDETSE